ncbi:MAG: alpha/beta hydrolase [Pseudomonadota bacterium]
MSWAGVYFTLAVLSALGTFAAVVQARQLYWLIPVYFLAGWLSGELAAIHLLWQLALTAGLAFGGTFSDSLAQSGLGIFVLCWIGKLYLLVQANDSPRLLKPALERGLGGDYRSEIPEERRALLKDHIEARYWLRPFRFDRDGVRVQRNLSYGDAGVRNLLDVYHPETRRPGGCPVLLQVHGGAWIIGNKDEQAKPLMYHMSERGWVCVSINYRLSPAWAFPAHIIDVKKAIAWVKENIAEYGGDPEFIAITGGSAGGHLSSLAALTPNLAEWQPGFEEVDTTLQAAMPFYGVFDFLDRNDIRQGTSMDGMLGDKVMQCSKEEHRDRWDQGSPISHINPDAPPFFVIQGTHDTLVWVEEARKFVSELQAQATQPVAYAELPGAQHAFEIFHSIRTDHTVNAAADFLEWSHARWLANQSGSDS